MDGNLVERALALIGTVQKPSESESLAFEGSYEPSLKSFGVKVGATIAWDSPLFGMLAGEVFAIHAEGEVEVFHPRTQMLGRIPLAWIRHKE